jgi:hypothetical protein
MKKIKDALKKIKEKLTGKGTTAKSRPLLHQETVDINIGIDFGTKYSKICYRNVSQEKSKIVKFSNGAATLESCLIPSIVCMKKDGTLVTGLTQSEWKKTSKGCVVFEFIKMKLAALDSEQVVGGQRSATDIDSSALETESLCAYFIATLIKRTKEWIVNNDKELFKNRTPRWSANLGVPVEYYDSPAIHRFRRVLSIAWVIADELDTSPMKMDKIIARYREISINIVTESSDLQAVPEIAAAVQSFLISREASPGVYIYFDIGGGTLDGVSFRFWQEDGESRVSFYSGKVGTYGVNILADAVASQGDFSREELESALVSENDLLSGKPEFHEYKNPIQTLVATVVCEGNSKDPSGFKSGINSNCLRVFVGGGGERSAYYKSLIQTTHSARMHDNLNIPPYSLMTVHKPRDLDLAGINESDYHRFAVSYGLSVPDGEIADYKLPSMILKHDKKHAQVSKFNMCKNGCGPAILGTNVCRECDGY